MTGPAHYREAERSLAMAENTYWEGPTAQVEFAQTALMAAQVHATLALAAVTAQSGREAIIAHDDVALEWWRALTGVED